MRFDILSNRPAAELAMRRDLLQRQVRAKEERSRAAVMRSQVAETEAATGARVGEQRFSAGGLAREELKRRHPYGLPAAQAETARISAAGYAGAAGRGATTAEGRLGLEREEFEYSKRFLESSGGMPGSSETEAGEVAKIKSQLGEAYNRCPEGFIWNGEQCTPME